MTTISLPWAHRGPETDDAYAIKMVPSQYRDVPEVTDATVLDLGAHIGVSARLFLERGAGKVIAVEADPDNAMLLRQNVDGLPVEVIEAAVIGGTLPLTVELWRNLRGKGRSMHSLRPHRGREPLEVRTVSMDALLLAWKPEVIKCDIEYGEYGLPQLTRLPDYVWCVALALHYGRPGLREKAEALIEAMRAQGFSPTREPRFTPRGWGMDTVWLR